MSKDQEKDPTNKTKPISTYITERLDTQREIPPRDASRNVLSSLGPQSEDHFGHNSRVSICTRLGHQWGLREMPYYRNN